MIKFSFEFEKKGPMYIELYNKIKELNIILKYLII